MYSQRRPSSSRPPRNGGGGYSSQRGRGTSSPGRNFESNGPANFRVHGKPIQIHDKYVQLARDSAANGDKILTENLLQHAEHYLRMQNFERDKSAPERSPERSSDSGEEEGDGGYRRFAPRSSSRRRWAVAPEGPAREGYASSEPASSTGEQSADPSTDVGEEQAQVEQRRPLSEGGLQTADAPASASSDDGNDGGNNNGNNNERDYSSDASYD